MRHFFLSELYCNAMKSLIFAEHNISNENKWMFTENPMKTPTKHCGGAYLRLFRFSRATWNPSLVFNTLAQWLFLSTGDTTLNQMVIFIILISPPKGANWKESGTTLPIKWEKTPRLLNHTRIPLINVTQCVRQMVGAVCWLLTSWRRLLW